MFPEVDEIRKRRKRLGISQKKLAELVGVSQPLIARIESGKFDPKLSLVKKILKTLEEIEGRATDARTIMHSPVICIKTNDDLKKAAKIMIEHEISQMPVLENNNVVGSITENSIIKAVLERGSTAESLRVRDVMEEPFPTVSPNENLSSITRLLLNKPAILVVDRGEIRGIITKQDVMKFLTM